MSGLPRISGRECVKALGWRQPPEKHKRLTCLVDDGSTFWADKKSGTSQKPNKQEEDSSKLSFNFNSPGTDTKSFSIILIPVNGIYDPHISNLIREATYCEQSIN